MLSSVNEAVGSLFATSIRLWVRIMGKTVAIDDSLWLDCPLGIPGKTGSDFYAELAELKNLNLQKDPDAGLLSDFEALRSDSFDPDAVLPEIRHFYERTSQYRLEAWSEAAIPTRIFLWALTKFISRNMNQLNFPVSSMDLSKGMTSEIIPMNDASGNRVFTGWLRHLALDNRVIYTGLYSVETPPGGSSPCVKVSFPLPHGSSTVFLRPESVPDGSFKLISSGRKFGDPGFYRIVETAPRLWRVWYIRTLRESFHVYVDAQGVLRTDHIVHFLGFIPLRLHYRLER